MNPKPDKLIPAIYGGVIMGVVSAVPFLSILNCLCCAGVMLGGFFAVMFYKNNFTPDTPPFTSNDCMTVGALSGVFGAIVGTVLSVFFLRIFGNIMGEMIINWLHNMDLNLPDEAWEQMEESLREGASIVRMVLQFFMNLVIDTLFGLLGGLIGYQVYKPKHLVMPPPPMSQPPATPQM
jgi:hypothetical protein